MRVLLLISLLSWQAAGQAPARDTTSQPVIGTATVSGVVVSDEAAPVPVRRARVMLQASLTKLGFSATTDDDGRFVMTKVAAGRYTLSVSKAAWLTSNYGAERPERPGTPLVVADGARVDGLTIRLSRGGVIAGTV